MWTFLQILSPYCVRYNYSLPVLWAPAAQRRKISDMGRKKKMTEKLGKGNPRKEEKR